MMKRMATGGFSAIGIAWAVLCGCTHSTEVGQTDSHTDTDTAFETGLEPNTEEASDADADTDTDTDADTDTDTDTDTETETAANPNDTGDTQEDGSEGTTKDEPIGSDTGTSPTADAGDPPESDAGNRDTETDLSCIGEGEVGEAVFSDECCDGLTGIVLPYFEDDGNGSEDCPFWEFVFVCTFCGNNECGPGENPCNCLEDCPAAQTGGQRGVF